MLMITALIKGYRRHMILQSVAVIQSNLSNFGKISRKCGVHQVFSMGGGKFYYMRIAVMCYIIGVRQSI